MSSQSLKVKNLRIFFLAALLLTAALILGACQDTGTGGGDTVPGGEGGVIETPQGDDFGDPGAGEDIEGGVPLETPEGDLMEDTGSGGEAGNMDETGQEDMSGEAGGVEGEETPESE